MLRTLHAVNRLLLMRATFLGVSHVYAKHGGTASRPALDGINMVEVANGIAQYQSTFSVIAHREVASYTALTMYGAGQDVEPIPFTSDLYPHLVDVNTNPTLAQRRATIQIARKARHEGNAGLN